MTGNSGPDGSPGLSPGGPLDTYGSPESTINASFYDNPSDKIIYQPKAFEGNQIFIYEEDNRRIHSEDLLEIIMKLIDEDI